MDMVFMRASIIGIIRNLLMSTFFFSLEIVTIGAQSFGSK